MTNPQCITSMSYCSYMAISFDGIGDAFTRPTRMGWIIFVHPMSPLSWLIVSVFEFLLFILVVRKAKYHFWCKRRSKEFLKARDIMKVMAKDSTNYFIMWVYTSQRIKIEYLCLLFYFCKPILYKCYRNRSFLCCRSSYLGLPIFRGGYLCTLNQFPICICSTDYPSDLPIQAPERISDYGYSSNDHISTTNAD